LPAASNRNPVTRSSCDEYGDAIKLYKIRKADRALSRTPQGIQRSVGRSQEGVSLLRLFGRLHFTAIMLFQIAGRDQLMLDENSIRNRNSLGKHVQRK
jgi:hypothetical protein